MLPAIITVTSPNGFARARREAEAALRAGQPVNIFTERQGTTSLVARVVPIRGGFLALTPSLSTTGRRNDIAGAILQPFAEACATFEGGIPERWPS